MTDFEDAKLRTISQIEKKKRKYLQISKNVVPLQSQMRGICGGTGRRARLKI